ncbi:unnamed protein product, partial [Effrenium voratum]
MSPDCDSRRPATRLQKVAAQLAVAIPELGWSVCEPLFMPLLLELEVPNSLLAICWVISPLAGLVLQPCVGKMSDSHGRSPFILFFSTMSVVGLTVTPLMALLSSKATAGLLAMMAFGVTDLSHDVLVTPTRAQMNDIFEPDAAESRSATSSGLAKVLALFCAFLLPRTFAFISVAGVVACATLLQLVASCSKTGVMAVARPMTVAVPSMNTGQDESPTDGGSISRYPRGFWQMWALQFVGWLSVCTWSFYFSSVWAQILQAKPGTPDFDAAVQQGTQWLLYGSIVFLAA